MKQQCSNIVSFIQEALADNLDEFTADMMKEFLKKDPSSTTDSFIIETMKMSAVTNVKSLLGLKG